MVLAKICLLTLLFLLCIASTLYLLNALTPSLPKPIRRFIQWSHAIFFECFVLLGVVFSRIFRRRLRGATGASDGCPILLVHGYLNDSRVWRYFIRNLTGLGPVYTIDLGHPFKSIKEYAEKVKAKALEIEKATGRKELILIGHSMGGLVSAWYAMRLAEPGKVTHVITIASPLSGTPVARIAIGPNGREMERNSALIQELQQAIAQNDQIHFYHIASQSDLLVVPGISALLGKSDRHLIIEDLGHASMLYSKRVCDQISEWLNKI